LPRRRPGFVRFSCHDCFALLRIDYRNDSIRHLRRVGAVLFLGIYMYLLYEALWGYAILLALIWGRFFYEVVALFAPKLKVIVVSPPLLQCYREMAKNHGLLSEDLGTTIHPLGLF
jgi:hypothetical protein